MKQVRVREKLSEVGYIVEPVPVVNPRCNDQLTVKVEVALWL